MTPIERRKQQKFGYRIFACKISCNQYTISEVDDIVMMTGNFTPNFCLFLRLSGVVITLVLKRQLLKRQFFT